MNLITMQCVDLVYSAGESNIKGTFTVRLSRSGIYVRRESFNE